MEVRAWEVGKSERRPVMGRIRVFNVTRHESEQTSDWCLFARAYGEHLKRGKQMGDGGGSTTRLCAPSSGWPELVPTMLVSQRMSRCRDNRAGLGSALEVLEPCAGNSHARFLEGLGGRKVPWPTRRRTGLISA
jgi:hypothetical protein